MKPTFQKLKSNYYSSNELKENYVSGKGVYSEFGIDHESLIKQNAAYVNTCAARMSLALLKSGVPFVGRMRIKSGGFKGKTLEAGAKLLADQLMKPTALGRPTVYKPADFMSKISGKKGVVLFWKITGYGGGHIDLIDSSTAATVCSSGCYYQSKEIWFWPLN